MLRAAILHECQNYLGGGGGLGAIIPDARPLGTFENLDSRDGKTGISKRSHEKIGDCEQSTSLQYLK